MKIATILSLSGASGAMLLTAPAHAVYTGLSVSGQLVSLTGLANPRMMYRVYANFTDANDYFTVGGGSPTGSPLRIESRANDDSAVGSAFFNPVVTHPGAQTPLQVFGGIDSSTNPIPPIPNAAFDTFLTIGVGAGQQGSGPNGSNETGFQGPPADFINGTSFNNNNCGWFTNGPVPQGRAGWTGDGDPLLRVLIMQLTVSSTSAVRGTMNVTGINAVDLAGQFNTFTLSGQTFAGGFVPAPGGLGLILAFGACGRRRRRHLS